MRRIFRANVLGKVMAGSAGPDDLREIAAASHRQTDGTRFFQLTPEEALKVFDFVLGWQPRQVPIDLDHHNARMTDLSGGVLVEAVFPVADSQTLGSDRIQVAFNKIEFGKLGTGLISVVDLVLLDPSKQSWAIELIRRAVFSRKSDTVLCGLSAIERWRKLSSRSLLAKLPRELAQTVISVVSSTREQWLSSALYIAKRLVQQGEANDRDKDELVFTLERLQAETTYSSLDTTDARSKHHACARQLR